MGTPTKDARPHRTNLHTPGEEPDSPIPPIHKQWADLPPSRELIEYYRDKIARYDVEQEELIQMLEKYKGLTEDQHKLQWDIRQREEEVRELQNALSNMEVFLFQEREHSLRLYAENDRLKIRELDDRRKIQQLLAGPDAGEITYFHREPPHKVTVTQKSAESSHDDHLNLRQTKFRPAASRKEGSRKKSVDGAKGESLEQYKNDIQTLLLQVEALQAQKEEQTRLVKDQVESLLEDQKIKAEEALAQRQRDEERITALTDKLQKTQNLLYESTRDVLQLRFDSRTREKSWMEEKNQLLRERDSRHNRLRRSGPETQQAHSCHNCLRRSGSETQQAHKEELKVLQGELKQTHDLAEMYREQCITLETELSQIREEGDVSREIYKDRSDKMAKRLQLMNQRYEALEKRRALEVEGFKTDLKHLRQKFKDIEKQLLKVTLNVGPNQDLAILHEVRQTNTRTKKVQSELMALKAKIYGLENELRLK